MKIGNLEIKYRAVPAPLASLTDIAFRQLLDEIGYSDFMVTEMISAEGLRRRKEKTLEMIRPANYKIPQFIQLFGSEPEQFVDAVKYVENETDYCGVDINMGCPANKVVKKGGGSALLKTPAQVAAIVRAVKGSTDLPVTVKIRLGFNQENVFELVSVIEAEGADAIAVHFRSRADGYTGEAKWQYAAEIKERLKSNILFIGNGDIVDAVQAKERLKVVDGIMIGRGAVANPLIFAEIAGAVPPEDSDNEKLNLKWVYSRLLQLIALHYEPDRRLARIKAYARFLFSNRRYSKRIRQKIYTSATFEEASEHFQTIMLQEYLCPASGGPSGSRFL